MWKRDKKYDFLKDPFWLEKSEINISYDEVFLDETKPLFRRINALMFCGNWLGAARKEMSHRKFKRWCKKNIEIEWDEIQVLMVIAKWKSMLDLPFRLWRDSKGIEPSFFS